MLRLIRWIAAAITISLPTVNLAAETLETVKLPGFSISLPPGNVQKESAEQPAGQYIRDLNSKTGLPAPKAMVLWLPQSMPANEWRDSFLPMLSGFAVGDGKPMLILRERGISDDRRLAITGSPDVPIGIAVANCAPEFSVAFVLRLQSDINSVEATTQKILESIDCHTTPENERRYRASMRLPAEFGDDSSTTMQRYRSLDDERINISFTQDNVLWESPAWRAMVRSVAAQDHGPAITEESLGVIAMARRSDGRPANLVRVDVPGRATPVYYGGLYCPVQDVTFVMYFRAPRVGNALAEQRLMQMSCPDPAPPEPPPFVVVARKACDAGDQRGCRLQAH